MLLRINCKSFDDESIDIDDAFDALLEEVAYKDLGYNVYYLGMYESLLFLKKHYKEVLSKNKIKNNINVEKVKVNGDFNDFNLVVDDCELIYALYDKFTLRSEYNNSVRRINKKEDSIYLLTSKNLHTISEGALLYEGELALKVYKALNYISMQFGDIFNRKDLVERVMELNQIEINKIIDLIDKIINENIIDINTIEKIFDRLLSIEFIDENIIKSLYFKLLDYYKNINKEYANKYEKFYNEKFNENEKVKSL